MVGGTHPEWTFKQFGEKTLPSGCLLEKDKLLSVSGKPRNTKSTFYSRQILRLASCGATQAAGLTRPTTGILLVYEWTNPHLSAAPRGRLQVFLRGHV